MIRFVELLIALLIVALIFVLVGLFLPSSRYIEHSLETNRPLRQVFDTVNSFRRADDWHPLRAHDPRIQLRLEGPDRGVGARMVYESRQPRIGSGAFEIIESVQDERVVFAAENDSYGENKHHEITLRQRGRTIELRWGYSVDYGWNLFGRYAGMYLARTVGDDVRSGLGNLVGLLATMPNFDYKALEISVAEVEPVHILYVSTKSDRNITAVENAMVTATENIRRAIRDNKLEPSGPLRLITTNFGSEDYEFDVAIPVRFPEGVQPPAADPIDEQLAAAPVLDDEGNPVAPPALPPLPGLKLPEGIQQGVGYGGRALMAMYAGHPAALPLVRDMLRSYAAAHGETIHDRAFEEYLTDIDSTASEDAEFHVYWPVRDRAQ
jgi:hypothetical protein